MPSCSVKVDGSARSVTVSAADMPLLSMLHDVLKLTRNKSGCGIEVRKVRTVIANGGANPDYVELINRGATTLDISGYTITDDPVVPAKFAFPVGTTIAAGGYLIV